MEVSCVEGNERSGATASAPASVAPLEGFRAA